MPDLVSVLVPYRPDGGWRDTTWLGHVRSRWLERDVELIVQSPAAGAHPGEFNHPAAINAAARRARGDVFLVADADTTWEPSDLPEQLVAAVRGGARWAMPRRYAQLTLPQTRRVLRSGASPSEALLDRAGWVGDSVSWAGLVCVPRAGFDAVKGYDERWEWWGADDMAFGLSMDTLWGGHLRVEGSCLHLWHPTPLAHNYGHIRHRDQYALGERYREAADDTQAMAALRCEEPGALQRDYS